MTDYQKNELVILAEDVGRAARTLRRDITLRLRKGLPFTNGKLQGLLFELNRAVKENDRLVRLLRNYL